MFILSQCRQSVVSAASLLAAVLFLPSLLKADDPADELLMRVRQARLGERVAVQEFFGGIQLTENQARRILNVLESSARLHAARYQLQAELLPQMASVFAEFAEEDSLNQGFSPQVERETAWVNGRAKESHETFVKDMMELEREVAEILSPAQLEYAKNFTPGNGAKLRPTKVGQTAPRPQAQRPRLRGNRATQRRANIGRQKPDRSGGSPAPQNERLAAARRELAELSRQMHPELSPVALFLLHPTAAEQVCAVLGSRPSQDMLLAIEHYERGTSAYPVARREQDHAKVAALRAQINNWNLINGLHLGRKQIGQILTMWDAFQAQLQQARGEASRGKLRKVHADQRATVADLELAVARVLNPGQREVLKEYKACLIPPKNLKDPVRIGQASDHSHLERWLSNARKAPPRRVERMIDNLLAVEEQHVSPLKPEERSGRVRLLRRTVAEAAKMTDVDFEVGKAELVERIAPRDRIEELKETIDTLLRRDGQPGKLAQFMLNPLFMEQLRLRGEQLARGVVPESADLSGDPQADNCAKGCAINPKSKGQAKRGDAKKP